MLRSLRSCLLTLPLLACSGDAPAVAPAAAPKVAPIAAPVAQVFYGVLTSRESALVTAKVDGNVKRLLVRSGPIKAGATIAILDDSMISKQLEEARAAEDSAAGALIQALGMAGEASRIYRLQAGLLKDGAVSRESVSAAASAAAVAGSQVTIARGTVARSKAAREQVEQLRDQTVVVAPIDGVASAPRVSEGQMATRGQPIVRISNPKSILVRFAVGREFLDKVPVGTKVDVIRVKSAGDPLIATVNDVGNTLAPPLQFAVVEAELEASSKPADPSALLGALVDVRVHL